MIELYLAGHNVAFTGEHTAIVQIEAGLEEYVSDINLMRREYLQVADTNNPADSHLRNAYHDAVAATNVLHQKITPLTTGANDTEAALPTCKVGTQTLSSQTWPGGGIEQNVGCLSAISKTIWIQHTAIPSNLLVSVSAWFSACASIPVSSSSGRHGYGRGHPLLAQYQA